MRVDELEKYKKDHVARPEMNSTFDISFPPPQRE